MGTYPIPISKTFVFLFPSKPLTWEYINFLFLCEFSRWVSGPWQPWLSLPTHPGAPPRLPTAWDPLSASLGCQPLPQQHLKWACSHLSCTHGPGWSWLPGLSLALHHHHGLTGAGTAPAAALAALLLGWGWWDGPWMPSPGRPHMGPPKTPPPGRCQRSRHLDTGYLSIASEKSNTNF